MNDTEKHILLGDLLKKEGYITQELIDIALKVQHIHKKYLGEVLVALNFVTSKEIALVIAKQSGVPYVDIDYISIPADILKMIPFKIAMEKVFLPL